MTDIGWTYPGICPTMSKLALCFEVWLSSEVVVGVAMKLLCAVEVTYVRSAQCRDMSNMLVTND